MARHTRDAAVAGASRGHTSTLLSLWHLDKHVNCYHVNLSDTTGCPPTALNHGLTPRHRPLSGGLEVGTGALELALELGDPHFLGTSFALHPAWVAGVTSGEDRTAAFGARSTTAARATSSPQTVRRPSASSPTCPRCRTQIYLSIRTQRFNNSQ